MVPKNPELHALRAARAHVRALTGRFDIAEFLAQCEAAKCIETLAAFRDDFTLAPDFRRLCALDLLERAYGKPKVKGEIQLSAPPPAEAADDLVQHARATALMADQFRELNAYVGNIPPEQWPAHVREMAGHVVADLEAVEGRPVIEGAAETS